MSVLMDGSTDSSVTEKEPFYVYVYGGMQMMKKLLINIETNFSWNDSVKKVANQNWKSKLLPAGTFPYILFSSKFSQNKLMWSVILV